MAQIVTITNPLTGQPAQVDQLEHTAQEIDDAIARALPGGAIDMDMQKKAEFTLLWENASPTSTFAAQTIDLDLSTYNSVFVQAKHENGPDSWVSPVITPVGSGGNFNAFASSGAYDAYRFFGTSASKVNFGDTSYWSEADNASYKDNRFLIPMRIYGVKGI